MTIGRHLQFANVREVLLPICDRLLNIDGKVTIGALAHIVRVDAPEVLVVVETVQILQLIVLGLRHFGQVNVFLARCQIL